MLYVCCQYMLLLSGNAIYTLADMLSVTEKILVTTLVTSLLLNFSFKFFFILFLYTVTKVTKNKVKF